jgi:hypothetical protein
MDNFCFFLHKQKDKRSMTNLCLHDEHGKENRLGFRLKRQHIYIAQLGIGIEETNAGVGILAS